MREKISRVGIEGLCREDLVHCTNRRLRHGKPWQADLLLVAYDGSLWVVKDYAHRPWFYREVIGRLSTWRERTFYEALRGIPGIPHFGGCLDAYAVVVEYIPGEPVSRARPGSVGPEFFEKLERVVEEVHCRGVVLCDLRHLANIIVSEKGDPYLVDFGTAFRRGKPWNFVNRWLYRLFLEDDRLGVIKIKRHLAPDLLSDAERTRLERGVFLQRPVVRIRDFFRGRVRKWF